MSEQSPQPQPWYPPGPSLDPREERTRALLAHVLSAPSWLFGLPFLGPLLVYLAYRDRSHFVREHAAEALNAAITVFLATLVGGSVALVVGFLTLGAGFLLLWLVALVPAAALVCAARGALAAHRGRPYRYPLVLRVLR